MQLYKVKISFDVAVYDGKPVSAMSRKMRDIADQIEKTKFEIKRESYKKILKNGKIKITEK